MISKLFYLTISSVLLALMLGCSSTQESESSTEPKASPEVSVIENFPLPPGAVLVEGPTESQSEFTGYSSVDAKYSVDSMTEKQTVAWYKDNGYVYSDIGKWEWCESFEDVDFWWREPGTDSSLGIASISASTTAAGNKAVTISVVREDGDSTPCRGPFLR